MVEMKMAVRLCISIKRRKRVAISAPAGWLVLDVTRKEARSSSWVALLLDVEPDDFKAGASGQPRWLELGKHKNLDGAWHHAKEVVATWH
jgi:hypothetical protein